MNVIRDKQTVGIFSSREEAEIALNQLRSAEFAMNQVSILAKDNDILNEESDQIAETNVHVQTVNETNQADRQTQGDRVVSDSYLVVVDGTESEILQAQEFLKYKKIHDSEVYNAPASRNYLEPVVSFYKTVD